MPAHARPWLAIAFLTWSFSIPTLWTGGTNVVTQTYHRAAVAVQSGHDPYRVATGKGDQYKYAPWFAAVYGVLARLPERTEALVWALLNSVVFWLGMGAWFILAKRGSPWFWLALGACAIELDTSLRYQQINAAMTGLILFGLARFRDRRWESSGGILATASSLKVLPMLFAVGLCIRGNRRYLAGLVAVLLALTFLPIPFLGWEGTWGAHGSWFSVLLGDIGAAGLLDIESVIARWGFPALGKSLRATVLLVSVALMAWMRWKSERVFHWGLWYALGAACLLLVSPRTESPTFVLFAPAYVFLASEASNRGLRTRVLVIASLMVAFFGVSFCFTDAWPKSLWDPRTAGYASKTLGVLLLWTVSVFLTVTGQPADRLRRSYPS